MAQRVDQILSDGTRVEGLDVRLTEAQKSAIVMAHLPGAHQMKIAGVRAVKFDDHVIFMKQVTHLGKPWPGFKKRIQIPKTWLLAEHAARHQGLMPHFVGIYRHEDVTIFVDFDPGTYVQRKANNSAAHVATNDLFQAQTTGQFARTDRNGNRLTSIRADELENYLRQGVTATRPRLGVFSAFNAEFLDGRTVQSLDAIREMHEAKWPDRFQGEWPGFYLEYRLDAFVRKAGFEGLVAFQKIKGRGRYDYDLRFDNGASTTFYGDLKASDVVKRDAPGNDSVQIKKCVEEFGRFWYVIYEHDTQKAKDQGDVATIAWNEWKRSVGYSNGKRYNPLSYASRFKASVRFVKMLVLEVNEANFNVVLADFAQGRQAGGANRALKVIIKKKNIDNFVIFSARLPTASDALL
jgi:hypothetical protein